MLLSLFLVTTSVSLDPEQPETSSLRSAGAAADVVFHCPPAGCCICSCHSGMDDGNTGLANCLLFLCARDRKWKLNRVLRESTC